MVQVLENSDGGAMGSLIACLDMCATVMGKRQLRAWLCRPMARIADITARQDAVAELMGSAAEAAQTARVALTGAPLCHRILDRHAHLLSYMRLSTRPAQGCAHSIALTGRPPGICGM